MTFARNAAVALVVLLLLVAGAWTSWGSAQHVLLSGREHGTLTVTGCTEDVCSGRFVSDVAGSSLHALTIAHTVAAERGETLSVVVKPGTDEAVRAGWGGGLHAWLPFGGALLLAAPLVGGGMRLVRTAWSFAAAGAAVLLGAFFLL
ncbi:hypothetical protein ABZ990_30045 [Streptomyces sp. NPDC046203]|uniref:hypothetical protein n=1 Tax=Streptomyces sp. NPDC046203 TaxID=3154602 RepID=UPI0033FAC870